MKTNLTITLQNFGDFLGELNKTQTNKNIKNFMQDWMKNSSEVQDFGDSAGYVSPSTDKALAAQIAQQLNKASQKLFNTNDENFAVAKASKGYRVYIYKSAATQLINQYNTQVQEAALKHFDHKYGAEFKNNSNKSEKHFYTEPLNKANATKLMQQLNATYREQNGVDVDCFALKKHEGNQEYSIKVKKSLVENEHRLAKNTERLSAGKKLEASSDKKSNEALHSLIPKLRNTDGLIKKNRGKHATHPTSKIEPRTVNRKGVDYNLFKEAHNFQSFMKELDLKTRGEGLISFTVSNHNNKNHYVIEYESDKIATKACKSMNKYANDEINFNFLDISSNMFTQKNNKVIIDPKTFEAFIQQREKLSLDKDSKDFVGITAVLEQVKQTASQENGAQGVHSNRKFNTPKNHVGEETERRLQVPEQSTQRH